MAYRDDPDALHARQAWLSRLRIATPCDASWEAMSGDDRVRRCGLCDRDVHDVSRMTVAEVQALFAGGRQPCVQLHRRRDGTVITSDCARGVAKRKRRLAIAGAAAACATALAMHGDVALEWLTPPSRAIPTVIGDRVVHLPRYDDPAMRAHLASLDDALEVSLGEPAPTDDQEAERQVDALLMGALPSPGRGRGSLAPDDGDDR